VEVTDWCPMSLGTQPRCVFFIFYACTCGGHVVDYHDIGAQ
jgi:hypothetical protein